MPGRLHRESRSTNEGEAGTPAANRHPSQYSRSSGGVSRTSKTAHTFLYCFAPIGHIESSYPPTSWRLMNLLFVCGVDERVCLSRQCQTRRTPMANGPPLFCLRRTLWLCRNSTGLTGSETMYAEPRDPVQVRNGWNRGLTKALSKAESLVTESHKCLYLHMDTISSKCRAEG